jgi:hypothetical protein
VTDPLSLIAEEVMLKDILDAQAECLMRDQVDDRWYVALFPHLRARLEPLLVIARLAKMVLVPISPARRYRDSLRVGLVAAARQRSARHPSVLQPWKFQKELVIGVAAVSSAVSVAGVAALLIRAHLARQQPVRSDAA